MSTYIGSKLAGKVAVVTGASKGIGRPSPGISRRKARPVVVNYASANPGADKVVADITGAGGRAVAIQADVARASDITRLFAETKKAFGRLDILVNNAGIYEFGPLEQITEEHFHKQFNLNVLGLILTTQEAAKFFDPAGGSIVNISSVVGLYPAPSAAVLQRHEGRGRCRHQVARPGTGPETNPGEFAQSRHGGNRGPAHRRIPGDGFSQADRRRNATRPHRPAR